MPRNIAPQDVSWFLDLDQRGRLNLNPPYQRKSVWTPRERRFFLDTVFNGYPCPPLFLHKTISDEGVTTYHVVDGKQRLETIINFSKNKIALSEDIQDDRLKGLRWKALDVDSRKRFWNYQLAVEMLDVVDDASLREIFDRYNRTSKNLDRQELRHARYDGWFKTIAEAESQKDEWRKLGIVTTASARRMRDVQFISELMVLQIKGKISGFSQDLLDQHYADYDNPAEVDPNFSSEGFTDKFESIKQIVLDVEAEDNTVTTFAKSTTNFYSLWATVALHQQELGNTREFARRYRDFMKQVVEILQAERAENVADKADYVARIAEESPQAFAYAQQARGANTELPQRLARHRAIEKAVLGLDLPANEDNE